MYGDPLEVLTGGDILDIIGDTEQESDKNNTKFAVRKYSMDMNQSGIEQGVDYSLLPAIHYALFVGLVIYNYMCVKLNYKSTAVTMTNQLWVPLGKIWHINLTKSSRDCNTKTTPINYE